jgi:indolepyruvate decarboxylase
MSDQSITTYSVANYIVDRLAALGARHVFNVPGNYSAQFLITAHASGKLVCVGTTNEMEAGYAADAQARLNGIGVACVTYGVGSFSALNAIAGSYVERCPVVLINGAANADKAQQLVRQGVLFAHAIDPLRTDEAVFRHVTADAAVITAPDDAPGQIDRVLRACITEKRPVYLEVQDGVWALPCDRPETPDKPLRPPPLTPQAEQDVAQSVRSAVAAVLQRISMAAHPVLWGGEELQRFGVADRFEQLVHSLKLPYSTTLLGKALVSERNEYFVGVYDSKFAPSDTRQVIEGSDCLVALGTIPTDFYGYIVAKEYDRMILAAGNGVRIGKAIFPNVPLDRFMTALLAQIKKSSGARTLASVPGSTSGHTPPPGFEAARRIDKHERIKQASTATRAHAGSEHHAAITAVTASGLTWELFFNRMHEFVDEHMYVLADTSLSLFPAAELLIPKRGHFIAQAGWLSIGYTVGAAVGVALQAGHGERVIVFAGDGGFQMIASAFSTLVQHQRPDIVFVFDNRLYGIEQFLIDASFYQDAKKDPIFFNRLPHWDYAKLAEAFGGKGYTVETMAELDAALDATQVLTDVPALIAVKIDSRSLPPELEQAPQAAAAALTLPKPIGFAPVAFN